MVDEINLECEKCHRRVVMDSDRYSSRDSFYCKECGPDYYLQEFEDDDFENNDGENTKVIEEEPINQQNALKIKNKNVFSKVF